GHAVVAYRLEGGFKCLWVSDRYGESSETKPLEDDPPPEDRFNRVCVAMAGKLADTKWLHPDRSLDYHQAAVLGEFRAAIASNEIAKADGCNLRAPWRDFQTAITFAERDGAIGEAALTAYFQRAVERAGGIIDKDWARIEALARELYEQIPD